MIGKLTIQCPPMFVRHVSKGLSITDELDAIWNLDNPRCGGVVRFPKCYVRMEGKKCNRCVEGKVPDDGKWIICPKCDGHNHSVANPLHWTVDACTAQTPPQTPQPGLSNVLILYVPPEPTHFEWHPLEEGFMPYMLAEAVDCYDQEHLSPMGEWSKLTLPDGRVGKVKARLPDAKAPFHGLKLLQVEAVVIEGTVEF